MSFLFNQENESVAYENRENLWNAFESVFALRDDKVINAFVWAIIDQISELIPPNEVELKVRSYIRNSEFQVSTHSSARVWFHMGYGLWQQGMLEKALECYDEALKLENSNSAIWREKGEVLWVMKKFLGALECLDKAIQINPTNGSYWLLREKICFELDMYKEALRSYDNAIRFNPSLEKDGPGSAYAALCRDNLDYLYGHGQW